MDWFTRDLEQTWPATLGPDVAHVQRRLRLPVSGVYGESTFEKVRAFQALQGLLATGVVDFHTARLLDRLPRAGLVPDWFDTPARYERAGELLGNPDDLESAVRRFQSASGLPLTGDVDEATAIALGD